MTGRVHLDATGFVAHPPGPAHAPDTLGDRKTRLQSILMEAGAKISPTEPCGAATLERPQLILRGERRRIEDRMLKVAPFDHQLSPRREERIERDETRPRVRQALQTVHPVGRRNGGAVAAPTAKIVPTRPDPPTARHQAVVGMHDGMIAGITESAEKAALLDGRIG